jgi:hypothetical protein
MSSVRRPKVLHRDRSTRGRASSTSALRFVHPIPIAHASTSRGTSSDHDLVRAKAPPTNRHGPISIERSMTRTTLSTASTKSTNTRLDR